MILSFTGTLFASAEKKIILQTLTAPKLNRAPSLSRTAVGVWQQWSKKLSETSAAVLIMNNADDAQSVTLNFNTVPAFLSSDPVSLKVRDVWNHADLGEMSTITVKLESHDSAFFVLGK